MQTQPTETAIAPTAHQLRLRAIVKRLVIDLGYLENYLSSSHENSILYLVAWNLNIVIDTLNGHLECDREKITPVATTDANQEISPVVYPPNSNED